MKRSFLVLSLFVVFGAARLASGAGMVLIEDSSLWPGPVPPHPLPPWTGPGQRTHRFAPLEVESVKVQTSITDQLAVTKVDQEFRNPTDARLEGTFVFPVPKGAHLDKFVMDIDGKQVEAELLPADKARHIYEEIVRKLRDPALLEYAGQDVFKVRIFPIEPHSRKSVSFSYSQLLTSDAGLIAYTLPLSTEKFSCKPVKNLSVKVELQTRRPLKSIYSPTHSVEIKRDGDNRAIAGLEIPGAVNEPDFTLYFSAEREDVGVNLLTYRSQGDEGYFLLLASPGLDLKDQKVIPKDVAFVLDTSGSMAGKKLDQAKKALQFCLENLGDNDRFELIRFSTEVEPLFGNLVEASGQNRARARDFVEKLRPMGATAIDDALLKALRLRKQSTDPNRPLVIIFLTDGRPTIGVTDETRIVDEVRKENDAHTRIFSFGIGTDVNAHLLDKITAETRGVSQYVLPEEDLELKVSSFFSKIKDPVLANPEITIGGEVKISKLYPSALPDIFKGEQLVLVGRYSGQGDASVILEGTVNGGTRKFAYDVKFPEHSSENDFIPRLWATRRVGYLLDEIRLHGENSELKDEVTALARQYGIVTPYTAYLIVQDEANREVPLQLRSMRGLSEDRSAREDAARSWQQFSTESGGDAGVASAMSGMALRSATAPRAATMEAEAAFNRRLGTGRNPGIASGSPNPAMPDQPGTVAKDQSAQFVGGKSFFLNGDQWVDSAMQKTPNLKHARLQFGSSEYFDFLSKTPQAASWLALGQKVEFVWDSVIYEISE
jgi:Ca-activated chloride channel homolog